MRQRFSSNSIEEPVMNLTPLIDVVFVILIIFIVIAPILNVEKIELAEGSQAPNDKSITLKDSGPITIHVRSDNLIYLNNLPVGINQLAEVLKREKMKYPNAKPQVFHDKKAHFGTYQSVKNAAEAAGFDEMEIVLKP